MPPTDNSATASSAANATVKAEDLNKILDVARALASAHELDDILKLIVNSACSVMEADRASVFLIDEETDELFIRVAMGEEMNEIRFPKSVGIAGHVATTGEVLNIPDAYEDNRFNRAIDKQTGYRTKAMLTMPLDTGENIVGVLQVINKDNDGVFQEYDEAVMSALAAQTAVTINNFWLNQEFLEKQEMQASLGIARTIQMSFLPDKAPEVPGLQIAAFSEMCDETGGDYYDFKLVDDDTLILVIGDVTGHGVGAAMLMATARSALHALWLTEKDPQVLLENLNNLLEEDMGSDRFITIFLGVFNMKKGELTYSSAGHDAPILYRKGTDQFYELDSTGIPLGMMDSMDFPNKRVFVKPDDKIYLMTDGVWEAMDATDETYGRERLFKFIRENEDATPEDTCRLLVEDVTKFCNGAAQRDDITLLTVGIEPRSGAISVHREPELEDFEDLLYEATFASTHDEKERVLDESMAKLMADGLVDELSEMVVRLCLDEAYVNAVEHGNESDANKKVTVTVSRDEDYWSVICHDEGEGFADQMVPDPDAPESLELDHGRGVLIMTECLDAVWYNERGNGMQMIRHIPVHNPVEAGGPPPEEDDD